MTETVIDLFSGLGGFSAAFLDRGWNVLRIDNDVQFEQIPHTLIADIMDLRPSDLPDARIILASPPCQCFSTAAIWRYWKDGQPSVETMVAVRMIKHTVSLIHAKRPRYWVLENPVGRLRRFLGIPSMSTWWAAWGSPYLKPTHLWGILPKMDWPKPEDWENIDASDPGRHQGVQETDADVINRIDSWYPGIERFGNVKLTGPAVRSLIPYAFSEALAIAAEKDDGQTRIEDHI